MKKILFTFILLFSFSTKAALYTRSSDLDLPECNNPKLIKNVFTEIKKQEDARKVTSAVEKRRQTLMLKDIGKFEEVSGENFTSQNDYHTANRYIGVKVNKGVSADAIRICKSTSQGEAGKLYFLVYYYNYKVNVEILNYLPTGQYLTTVY